MDYIAANRDHFAEFTSGEDFDAYVARKRDPHCYGYGKVRHARSYAKSHGIDLRDCAFYTDSFSDLRTLELVGRPVCVAPDPRLARAAKKRGWSVEDWD